MTLRNLLIALFVVGLIACSSNPTESEEEEDVFEPYQVGTFMVTSPDTAEWIGSDQNKNTKAFTLADTDTITVTDTTNFEIEATNNPNHEDHFNLDITFHDTVTQDFLDSHTLVMPNERFAGSGGPYGSTQKPKIWIVIYYDNCRGFYDDGNPKWLGVKVGPDKSKYYYRFDVEGLAETATEVAC